MPKAMLFVEKRGEISDFDFGKDTAVVFDDMLDRAVDGSQLYDLGCSTANALIQMDPILPAGVRFVGIDFSNDPLLAGRLFSYQDTQISRLGT